MFLLKRKALKYVTYYRAFSLFVNHYFYGPVPSNSYCASCLRYFTSAEPISAPQVSNISAGDMQVSDVCWCRYETFMHQHVELAVHFTTLGLTCNGLSLFSNLSILLLSQCIEWVEFSLLYHNHYLMGHTPEMHSDSFNSSNDSV